jgi:hypothetical protein
MIGQPRALDLVLRIVKPEDDTRVPGGNGRWSPKRADKNCEEHL